MQGVFLQHPQKSRSHSDQVLTLAKEGDERARSSMLKVCKQNRSSHADFFLRAHKQVQSNLCKCRGGGQRRPVCVLLKTWPRMILTWHNGRRYDQHLRPPVALEACFKKRQQTRLPWSAGPAPRELWAEQRLTRFNPLNCSLGQNLVPKVLYFKT